MRERRSPPALRLPDCAVRRETAAAAHEEPQKSGGQTRAARQLCSRSTQIAAIAILGASHWLGVQCMTESAVGKHFGVIDDDQRRAISGLEFVQGLVDGTLPLNTMAETLGYDIVEVSKGRVVVAGEPRAGQPQPCPHCPRRPCCNVARQLHGTRCQVHAGQGLCPNYARVQDFSCPAYYPADRPGEG